MANVFLTVQGNLEPAIEITCKRKKKVIDLTDVESVKLIILNPKTKTITNEGHQNCTIIDTTGGVVSYAVEDGDFDDPEIDYLSEVEITYNNGRPEILYDLLTIDPRPRLTPPTVVS